MIDSHCHIDFPQFDADRTSVLEHAAKLGIHTILVPGTQARNWRNQIQLSHHFPQLKIALGLHPYFLQDFEQQDLVLLEKLILANRTQILAVGEIGLDFHISVDKGLQQDVLEKQLQLASEFDLPVILHHRQSHNQLIRTLKQYRLKRSGVVHAFSGSLQQANSYIEMGFKLGVGGTITYPRANKTRTVFANVPLESLLIETDAPDMLLMGCQGQRNSPELLPKILEELAAIRSESLVVIDLQLEQNFAQLFY